MIQSFKLERYLLGDLTEDEMQKLKQLEATDVSFAARVNFLRKQNKQILEECPFSELSKKQPLQLKPKSFKGYMLKIAAAIVIVTGIFVAAFNSTSVYISQNNSNEQNLAFANNNYGERLKGMNAKIDIWKKLGDSAVQMQNMDLAHEGDELQLRYLVPQKCYGLMFSLDGFGAITMHMSNAKKATLLEPGKMISLPFAYKLDNAPYFEKFFLLTSNEPFEIDTNDIDKILKAKGIHIANVTVRKVREQINAMQK